MGTNFSTERISNEYLALNSCGIERFYDTDGHCQRPFGRADYHILYVSDGCCYASINGTETVIPKGNIILYRPGECQKYSYLKKDSSVSYYIHFTGVGCKDLLEKLGIYKESVIYIGKNIHFEEVFDKLLREYMLKKHAYEYYAAAHLLELLATISRYSKIKKSNIPNRKGEIVSRACHKIYDDLSNVTITTLAAESYMSIGHFSHIFKEVTGTPPLEYINKLKIQKAKDMLINTDFPINKIASDCGFSDQNYFSRIFKKVTGVSPSKFRE